jgi:tRNA pseudouridine55 synthase
MNGKFQRSGILLVDKPAGISSASVTNQLKKKFAIDRIGHGGTLDPFATGLLVVLIGEATKIARFMLEGEKEYEALAKLGEETSTGDLDGEIIQRSELLDKNKSDWELLAKKFLGRQQQTPPAYSAIKFRGKPLYEYARQGQEVDIRSREIHIKSFEILETSSENIRFRVRSSGGTYIRVLANDLAKAAGSCAHLRSLRRLASSQFQIESAHSLDALLEMEKLPLVPVESALDHLPKVEMDPQQALKVRQGNLSVFDFIKHKLVTPGFFLIVTPVGEKMLPVAVANHNPMMIPFCSIERVFDPSVLGE